MCSIAPFKKPPFECSNEWITIDNITIQWIFRNWKRSPIFRYVAAGLRPLWSTTNHVGASVQASSESETSVWTRSISVDLTHDSPIGSPLGEIMRVPNQLVGWHLSQSGISLKKRHHFLGHSHALLKWLGRPTVALRGGHLLTQSGSHPPKRVECCLFDQGQTCIGARAFPGPQVLNFFSNK
jgi:hypothetical protein